MRRVVVILIAALVLAVIVGLVLVARRKSTDKVVMFPGGVEVGVVGVFPGGKTVSSDKPWTAALRKVLPAGLHGKLPPVTSITCSSDRTNQLMVFFELTSSPWEWIQAVDENGFAYPRSGGSCSSSLGNGQTLYGVPLESFPRRQKTFRVNFLDTEFRVLAQMRVANPFPVPPLEQPWQAQALPIVQTNGELALTLISAREETNRWGSHLRPEWKQQAFGRQWEDARVAYHRVADPTGNEGGFLSPNEKVWQIKTSVHRTRLDHFAADEKMSVTNVTIPAPAQMTPLNTAAYCAGVKVVVEGLCGPGTLHVTNGVHRGMTSNTNGYSSTSMSGATTVESLAIKRTAFLVEVTGMSPGDELVVGLKDGEGRAVKAMKLDYRYRSSGVRIYQVSGLDPIDPSQSLSLELAISRPKEFVFYISPRDIQPPQ
ncbi:MAG TPA: hypothetical protein VFZ59_24690 [Verrucomicrobiae bacterium]|nr:hypothetical protein [Verrucomicrobiae bacterium]